MALAPAHETLARAHYEDAWLYDHRYQRRSQDVAHYVSVSKRGPVLELGAGTGRITLPLARAGIEVTALEREQTLCTKLYARLDKEPIAVRNRVHVVRADFRKLPKLNQRFAAVLAPFNAFSHLYDVDDLSRVLVALRVLLRPGGVLAFDVPLPCAETLAYDPNRKYRVGNAVGEDGTRYAYFESFEHDAAAQTLLVVAHYETIVRGRPRVDHAKSFVLPLLHRQYYPRELAYILKQAGYRIVRHEGDFAGAALSNEADSQVVVAK